MKLFFCLILALIICNKTFAEVTFEDQTKNALNEMEQIDNEFLFIKTSGEERVKRFFNAYANGNVSLPGYFGNIENTSAGPNITFKQVQELTFRLLKFLRPEQHFVLKINKVPKEKSFHQNIMYYTVGTFRALEKIEHLDALHFDDASVLKKKLTTSISQIILQLSLDDKKWDNIYFLLSQSYNSNFDADFVVRLASTLNGVLLSKESSELEKKVANNLLLEVSLLCFSRCTEPTFKIDSSQSRKLSDIVKYITSMCFENCLTGLGWNPFSTGFYSSYLTFLKEKNDKDYDLAKNKVVWKYAVGTLKGSLFSFRTMFTDQPFVYLKQGFGEFLRAILLFVGFAFHYAPIYFLMFIVSFILMTYFGKEKYQWKKKHETPKNLLMKIFFYLFGPMVWIFKFIILSLKIFFKNLWNSIGTNDKIHAIALNIFVVGTTLLISDLFTYIDDIIFQ